MKNLLFLAFVLILVLSSCERQSGKKVSLQNEVTLVNGVNKAVTLPVTKIGDVPIEFKELKELVLEASTKSYHSCNYPFTYQPYAVFVKLNEFKDVVVSIRFKAGNDKEEVNVITITTFSNSKIYEFYIEELNT